MSLLFSYEAVNVLDKKSNISGVSWPCIKPTNLN